MVLLEINKNGLTIGAVLALVKTLCEIYQKNTGKTLTPADKDKFIKLINSQVAQGAVLGMLPLPVQLPVFATTLYINFISKVPDFSTPRQW
jgi:hypothetical protein